MTNASATPTRPTLAMAADPERGLLLAPNFQPDVDTLVSEGVIAFGCKGSGKSNLVARIVEQLRRFHLPQLVLDTEGEQSSLLELLPHGVLATASHCPSGRDIIEHGLQVILDLRSWSTDEAAALAMCQLIDELFTTCKNIDPIDRFPCIIHLDEAAYWLPQDAVTYLSKETRKALADSFHTLASRGRKYGLTPFLYTQSISEIRKETIRQAGIQILMRQTLDVDLNRYCDLIYNATSKTRAAIRSYPRGKAVVLLPDGSQPRVEFYERETPHMSHTPSAQTAVKRFARTAVDVEHLQMLDLSEASAKETTSATPKISTKANRAEKPQPKGPATIKEWAFSLLDANPTLSAQQLTAITGRPTNTVQIYRTEYFVLHPEKKPAPKPSKMEQAIRNVLVEDPSYTPSQIQHRTNYSLRDVRRILARIQSGDTDLVVSEVH
jgi:hypothetical protein